jgi:CHAT domain-containing protein
MAIRKADYSHLALTFIWLICAGWLAAQTAPLDIQALEQRGESEFNSHNCPAAEKTFAEALLAAQSAGDLQRTGVYYIRIGNCRTRAGDFTAALEAYRHGIALAESIGDRELLEASLHGAALRLNKLGRINEAISLGQRELQLTESCPDPLHRGRAFWLMGALYDATGRMREGLQMMNRALTTLRAIPSPALTGTVLQALANAYLALGDVETAEHMEKEVLAMPEKDLTSMATTYSPALTYANLGEIQLQAGHPAQARKSFERAIEISTAPDEWQVHMDALLNLAKMQNQAGQIADADAGFRQALEIAGKLDFPEGQSHAWQMRSDALLIRGDIPGALDAGAESLAIARQQSSPDRIYKSLLSEGAANSAAGRPTTARAYFDEALGIAETLRAQSPGEVSDRSRAFANFIPIYQSSVRNLMDLHLPADALQRAEQAKARVLMDILLRGGVDERAAMTRSEAAQQDKFRTRLAQADAAGSTAALEAMLEYRQFRRTLYDNHPDLAVQSADFEAAGPDQLAALLPGRNTALLDYFLVSSGVALFVVRQSADGSARPDIFAYFLPDPKHTLAAEARSFRERLANRDLDYKPQAQHLFNRILAPATAALRGATNWIVSPDGALWDIPFEALVDPAGRYVIEIRTVSLAPSLTAALKLHRRQRPVTSGRLRLLALGNPLPSPEPLPNAAREVEQIGGNYSRGSALVLTGMAATAAEFRDRASAAQIIHLAAHAGLNDRDPLSSFVRLGTGGKGGNDGMVTALDIMSMHLSADMVVLSACETALGRTGPGEGMIGMGWALSAAGAASSVLSLWKVDSASSKDFMISFYAKLAAGGSSGSRAAALRQAGLEMLQSPAYRHPFYWAAFTLWGDGAAPSSPTASR